MAYQDTDTEDELKDRDSEEEIPKRLLGSSSLSGMGPIVPQGIDLSMPKGNVPSITGMSEPMAPDAPLKSITAGPLGGSEPIVPAPRPAQDRLAQLQAAPAAITQKHGIGGGILKGLDLLGSAVAPRTMSLIPGTELGHERQIENAQQAAKDEQSAITGGQQERQATAQTEETNARTGLYGAQAGEAGAKQKADEAAIENVTIIGPNGITYNVPRKDAEKLMGVMATQAGAGEREKGKEDTQKEIFGSKGQAVTLQLPNGQKAPGKKTPTGDLLLADGSAVPKGTMLYQQPNYGELVLPTKTTNIMDPNTGIPTTMGWNEKTQRYDIPQGVSGAGAYGHEIAQAGAVKRGGEQLITDIQANKSKLGTLTAWVKKYGLDTPIADPDLAQLQAELGTFAALQPAMHGFRSKSAMETFEKLIGGLQQNPDATISSIRGILKTAGAINPSSDKSHAPKVGDVDGGYKFNGGDPGDKNNWEKVK